MPIFKFTLVFGVVLPLSLLLLFVMLPSLTPLVGFGQTAVNFTSNNEQTAVNFTSNNEQTTGSSFPKPVEGIYIDNITGLKVTFPSGWNGFESVGDNNVKTATVSKKPSLSFSKNLWENSPPYIFVEISPKGMMFNSGQPTHYGNVINYGKLDTTKYCNLLSSNNVTIDSAPGKEINYICPFPFYPSVKEEVKAIAIEKDQTNFAIEYLAISEANYNNYLPEFENMIQSIQFLQ
jgi:hypothetical protein